MKIKKIAYHRNGVCGEQFHVVLFSDKKAGDNMVGIVFSEPNYVAVLDLNKTLSGDIEFHSSGNSWRGDFFEPELRQAIKEADEIN